MKNIDGSHNPPVVLDDEHINIILNDLIEHHGYDFRGYSRSSLTRRIYRLMSLDKYASFAEFRFRLRYDEGFLNRFVEEITVNVTEMFRDPEFYRVLRKDILPLMATKPLIRIWHAGCSTGEEVYSMAILLREVNLLHKSLLYATDINPVVLDVAREGIYPLTQMKTWSENYILAGGKQDFSRYYTANYNRAKLDSTLSERFVLSTHNLVSDRSFNEFQLILCRNVLIYFDKPLQEKVLALFDESLESLGFLALGTKETLKFSAVANKFQLAERDQKIWRKIA
ncbi:MAG TPA: protein-glutamate O-methyltransferase CheR [Cellvibrio sp.]|nr:protein-glutamate O-methyltransferase CheR [Cellvibrio sp.]